MQYELYVDGKLRGKGDLKLINKILSLYYKFCKTWGYKPLPHEIILIEQ